ncbi:unnamed protein product [Cylicocyclus nassatus]|uniref:Uncharacterized protein n=1 Tax=Cylicocyclus nassatus TaxID=53992 RepID=A0AA36MAU3_CYLNA|nr:unnamed protein product [Cylicocyclus nassatus]
MEQRTMDVIIASAWFTLSLYCILANFLLFALISSSIEMRTYTSYWIIISSSLCEISYSLYTLCFMIPATLLHDTYSRGDSTYSIIITALSGCLWYIEIIHIALMAINSENTLFLLFLCYVVGIAVSIPLLTPCCYMLYDSFNYTSYPENSQTWFMTLDLCLNIVILVIVITSYTAVLRKLHTLRRSSKQILNTKRTSFQTSKEMRLLAQFKCFIQELKIVIWSKVFGKEKGPGSREVSLDYHYRVESEIVKKDLSKVQHLPTSCVQSCNCLKDLGVINALTKL